MKRLGGRAAGSRKTESLSANSFRIFLQSNAQVHTNSPIICARFAALHCKTSLARLYLSADITQNTRQNAEQAAHADLQRRVADELLELFLIGQRLLKLGEQVDELV